MAHRTFFDADGNHWQAWDVVPQYAERRHVERRVPPPKPVAEERRGLQRRRRVETRVRIREGFEQGWLTFESPAGTKRLAPIPQGWDSLPDCDLEALCRAAMEAPRHRRRLIE